MSLSSSEERRELEVCQEIGRQARSFYPLMPWFEVEPLAREVWVAQGTRSAWSDVAPIVRMIWLEPEA